MSKYHISPSTGRPNLCHASVRTCPVGGAEDHYASKEEARAGFEEKMKQETLPPAKSKTIEIGSKDYYKMLKRENEALRADNEKAKRGMLVGAPNYELSKFIDTMDSLGKTGRRLQEEEAAINRKLRELDPDYPAHRQEAAQRAWDKLSSTNDEFDREAIEAAFEEVKDDPHFTGYQADDFGSAHEMFDELVMIREF